jgi:hypothetical protein
MGAKGMNCLTCQAPTTGKAQYCDPCRARRRARPPKYQPTEAIDKLIQEAWQDGQLHGKAAALWVHERLPAWPAWAIKRRATNLGLARPKKKEPQWCSEEIEILERFAWMCPTRIRLKLKAAGYLRTDTSIFLKRKRLRLLSGLDGYSARQLAGLFGCDVNKILRWISAGWLKAVRRSESGEMRDKWWIEHKAVGPFVLSHLQEVDLAKVDKLWFVATIAGNRFDEINHKGRAAA